MKQIFVVAGTILLFASSVFGVQKATLTLEGPLVPVYTSDEKNVTRVMVSPSGKFLVDGMGMNFMGPGIAPYNCPQNIRVYDYESTQFREVTLPNILNAGRMSPCLIGPDDKLYFFSRTSGVDQSFDPGNFYVFPNPGNTALMSLDLVALQTEKIVDFPESESCSGASQMQYLDGKLYCMSIHVVATPGNGEGPRKNAQPISVDKVTLREVDPTERSIRDIAELPPELTAGSLKPSYQGDYLIVHSTLLDNGMGMDYKGHFALSGSDMDSSTPFGLEHYQVFRRTIAPHELLTVRGSYFDFVEIVSESGSEPLLRVPGKWNISYCHASNELILASRDSRQFVVTIDAGTLEMTPLSSGQNGTSSINAKVSGGNLFAFADRVGEIAVYDCRTREVRRYMLGSNVEIRWLDFTSDEKYLLVSSTKYEDGLDSPATSTQIEYMDLRNGERGLVPPGISDDGFYTGWHIAPASPAASDIYLILSSGESSGNEMLVRARIR